MNKEHRIERDRDREIERELERSVRSGSHAASDRSLNSVPCSSGSSLDWGARWERERERERERSVGTPEHKAKEERARCGVERRCAFTE
jgi:hypothetical protein